MPASGGATRPLQLLIRCDAELLPDEIDAGDEFGHRMLHLQPGVELDEVVRTIGCQQKLERAGVQVADRARRACDVGFHRLASRLVERR